MIEFKLSNLIRCLADRVTAPWQFPQCITRVLIEGRAKRTYQYSIRIGQPSHLSPTKTHMLEITFTKFLKVHLRSWLRTMKVNVGKNKARQKLGFLI